MKFEALPNKVDAYVIAEVLPVEEDGSRIVVDYEDIEFRATPEMLSRINPVPGDFVVIQLDGYVYLNPRRVFLSKYAPAEGGRNGRTI